MTLDPDEVRAAREHLPDRVEQRPEILGNHDLARSEDVLHGEPDDQAAAVVLELELVGRARRAGIERDGLLEQAITLDAGTTSASDQLKLEYDSRGLVIRLAVKDVFAPGEIVVPEDLRPLLDTIGKVLTSGTHLIRIEGHADSSEARTLPQDYPSLWELSAARAAWVARFWMKRFHIDPSRIGFAGYADQRPLGPSTSDVSRGRNRRVEIIVLNDRHEAPPKKTVPH